jgi:tetratricopeptide (TPR) repeat protein
MDVGMNYQWGLYALRTLHLYEVVEVRSKIRLEDYLDVFGTGWWNRAWFAHLINAHHGLGDYKQELKEIYRAQKVYPDYFNSYEVRALAALGRINEVKEVIDKSFSITSRSNAEELAMLRGAQVLRRHKHMDAYREIAARLIEWNEYRLSEQEETRSLLQDYAEALYLAERWEEAHALYKKLSDKYPDNIVLKGCLGTTEARIGNNEKARQISEELKDPNLPYLRGRNTFWRARIASVLGEKDRAVSLLRQALSEGQSYSLWVYQEIDLEPLLDFKPYKELVRPKR